MEEGQQIRKQGDTKELGRSGTKQTVKSIGLLRSCELPLRSKGITNYWESSFFFLFSPLNSFCEVQDRGKKWETVSRLSSLKRAIYVETLTTYDDKTMCITEVFNIKNYTFTMKSRCVSPHQSKSWFHFPLFAPELSHRSSFWLNSAFHQIKISGYMRDPYFCGKRVK